MKYYFYKITNNINGKFYYGVHKTTNIDDGYMGSGVYLRRAYNKHGIENFTKTILKYFSNSDDMYKYEAEIVTEDLVRNPMCYNINLGGRGGSPKGELNPLYHKDFTQEHKDNISNSLKGKKKSDIHCKHLSESMKGREAWNKGKSGYTCNMSEQGKQNISNYWKTHKRNKEQYQKCWDTRKQKGTTNAMHGKHQSEHQKETLRQMKWMYKVGSIIRVNQNDVEHYKNMGYELGRKKL